MPTPRVPPYADELFQAIADLQTEVSALAAAISAQTEDLERIANFQRLAYENMYGPDTNSSGIWDGTDRYPG